MTYGCMSNMKRMVNEKEINLKLLVINACINGTQVQLQRGLLERKEEKAERTWKVYKGLGPTIAMFTLSLRSLVARLLATGYDIESKHLKC